MWQDELLKRLPKEKKHAEWCDPAYENNCNCGAAQANQVLAEVRKVIEGMELEVEVTDQKAIDWLKIRIGKLTDCNMADRDKVYTLAINALEGRQAMKEQAKP